MELLDESKNIGNAKVELAKLYNWAKTSNNVNESKHSRSTERAQLTQLCHSLVDDKYIFKVLRPEQHHYSHWCRAASIVQNYVNEEGEMVSVLYFNML